MGRGMRRASRRLRKRMRLRQRLGSAGEGSARHRRRGERMVTGMSHLKAGSGRVRLSGPMPGGLGEGRKPPPTDGQAGRLLRSARAQPALAPESSSSFASDGSGIGPSPLPRRANGDGAAHEPGGQRARALIRSRRREKVGPRAWRWWGARLRCGRETGRGMRRVSRRLRKRMRLCQRLGSVGEGSAR